MDHESDSRDLVRSNIQRGLRKDDRQRRKIVSEEEYQSLLSGIITRDYYPSLPSLHRDAIVLQKRSEGDIASAVAIRRAARQIATNEELLQKEEEMDELIARDNGGIRKRPRPLERESIDGFHARVTSEDNAEFEMNMKEEARQKREQMDIVFNTFGSDYKKVGQLLLTNDTGGNDTGAIDPSRTRGLCATPLMASDEFTAPVHRIQAPGTTVDGKNKTDRNSLFFTPNHYTSPEPSALCTTNGKTTSLMMKEMPPPSNNPLVCIHSSLPFRANTSMELRSKMQDSETMHLIEYQAKPSIESSEKRIIPANTRFAYQTESRIVVRTTRQTIEAPTAAVKTEYAYETDSSTTDLDASPLPLTLERRSRLDRIERDRNTFVAMTPLIVPGGGGDGSSRDDDSPIITWGNVASTPLVSGGERLRSAITTTSNINDEQENMFKLPVQDKTEVIAKAAEAKLAKLSKRFKEAGGTTKDAVSQTGSSSLSSVAKSSILDRTRSLTPAARSLLEKSTSNLSSRILAKSSSMKIAARSGSAFGSALRNSYTPNSQRDRVKSSRSQQRKDVYKSTPLASSGETGTRDKDDISIDLEPTKNDHKESATAGLLKM